jgi:transposase-like protein
MERARSEGLQLTGQGGLLQQLTKRVLESALEGEITDHVGYEKHDAVGKNTAGLRGDGGDRGRHPRHPRHLGR